MRVRNIIQVGGLLQQRRQDLDLTQAEVAERAGVSRDWMISIENGRRSSIDFDRLLRTLDALDLELEIAPESESEPTAADLAVLATLTRPRSLARQIREASLPKLSEEDRTALATLLQPASEELRGRLRSEVPATESYERLQELVGTLVATESLSEELRQALQAAVRSAARQVDPT